MSERFEVHLKRETLSDQVCAAMRKGIDGGQWSEWLPTERELCDLFNVSRQTVRIALDELKQIGLVTAQRGRGTRIVAQREECGPGKRNKTGLVGVILPEPLHRYRQYFVEWMEELKGMLFEEGVSLRFFVSGALSMRASGADLHRLIRRNPCDVWITPPVGNHITSWFEQREIPCISTCFRPEGKFAVFVDMEALGRHAASTLLRSGHRRIAFVCGDPRERVNRLPIVRGFFSALRGYSDGEGVTIVHAGTISEVKRKWSGLLKRADRPTGVLVGNPSLFLTLLTITLNSGVRVPEELSMITTFGESFLPHVFPEPSRYDYHPHVLARRTLVMIRKILSGAPVRRRRVAIMPDFIAGATIAPGPQIAVQAVA